MDVTQASQTADIKQAIPDIMYEATPGVLFDESDPYEVLSEEDWEHLNIAIDADDAAEES